MKMRNMRKQRGFTFVEMMVTIAISSMITYAIFAVLRLGDVHSQTAQLRMTIQDSAREGLYKMVQEIRQSAPSRIAIAGGANNNTIQFNIPNPVNPVAADFSVNWAGSNLIRYALGGTNNRQIIRTNLTTGQTSVMANDVATLTITGNNPQPTVVTVTVGVQRTLVNNRVVPAVPLQMTAQAEVRNT